MKPVKPGAPLEKIKERLKEINVNLTNEDLSYETGEEYPLIARLEKMIKRTPDEIRALIESISHNESKAGQDLMYL